MNKWMSVIALGVALAVVGCKSSDKNSNSDMNGSSTSSTDPKKMSADACSHCAGVQTATADGKCPVCGAKVQ